MEIAASTGPEPLRTGADTEATPASRSPTDWAQPRRRTEAKVAEENAASCSPPATDRWSCQANRTWAAEPAFIENSVPTGMESRSPIGRSTEATHTRAWPYARKIWADSPVVSRNQFRTGSANVVNRSVPAAVANSWSRLPKTYRELSS